MPDGSRRAGLSVEALEAVANHQGVASVLDADRLEVAREALEGMRDRLDDLRSLDLAYVGDVIEPATATAWIERGAGR
ncbi:MAG: hypothetical protein AB7L84_12830 [Acidimicrobiia bacterium]